ncbi:hypothetical protein [Actinoplanes rectilineatus]|uniref:hypothetical protein n=1 Tax=Actinoplanes rectilineatus TaxID=113571 RepID=UPI0005F2BA78|nr:hypothetical protein [Actinoplanes rectilineatus]
MGTVSASVPGHATDIPFVFDTIHLPELAPRLGAAPSVAVAATVHGAWVSFVRDGHVPWRPFRPDRTVGLLAAGIRTGRAAGDGRPRPVPRGGR